MNTDWTSFRKNDLVAAFERGPQQVRPVGLRRMTLDQLRDAMGRAVENPQMSNIVTAMRDHMDTPQSAILGKYASRMKWCE